MTNPSTGSNTAYAPPYQGAVSSRTGQAAWADTATLFDFGATGNGYTDDSAALQAAINACGVNFGTLHIVGLPAANLSYTAGGTTYTAGTTYFHIATPPGWSSNSASGCHIEVDAGVSLDAALPQPDRNHDWVYDNDSNIIPFSGSPRISPHDALYSQNSVIKFDSSGNPINSSMVDNGTNVTATEPFLFGVGSATAGTLTLNDASGNPYTIGAPSGGSGNLVELLPTALPAGANGGALIGTTGVVASATYSSGVTWASAPNTCTFTATSPGGGTNAVLSMTYSTTPVLGTPFTSVSTAGTEFTTAPTSASYTSGGCSGTAQIVTTVSTTHSYTPYRLPNTLGAANQILSTGSTTAMNSSYNPQCGNGSNACTITIGSGASGTTVLGSQATSNGLALNFPTGNGTTAQTLYGGGSGGNLTWGTPESQAFSSTVNVFGGTAAQADIIAAEYNECGIDNGACTANGAPGACCTGSLNGTCGTTPIIPSCDNAAITTNASTRLSYNTFLALPASYFPASGNKILKWHIQMEYWSGATEDSWLLTLKIANGTQIANFASNACPADTGTAGTANSITTIYTGASTAGGAASVTGVTVPLDFTIVGNTGGVVTTAITGLPGYAATQMRNVAAGSTNLGAPFAVSTAAQNIYLCVTDSSIHTGNALMVHTSYTDSIN